MNKTLIKHCFNVIFLLHVVFCEYPTGLHLQLPEFHHYHVSSHGNKLKEVDCSIAEP